VNERHLVYPFKSSEGYREPCMEQLLVLFAPKNMELLTILNWQSNRH